MLHQTVSTSEEAGQNMLRVKILRVCISFVLKQRTLVTGAYHGSGFTSGHSVSGSHCRPAASCSWVASYSVTWVATCSLRGGKILRGLVVIVLRK